MMSPQLLLGRRVRGQVSAIFFIFFIPVQPVSKLCAVFVVVVGDDKGCDPAMLTYVWSAMAISVISWHRWVVGRRADSHRDFLVTDGDGRTCRSQILSVREFVIERASEASGDIERATRVRLSREQKKSPNERSELGFRTSEENLEY